MCFDLSFIIALNYIVQGSGPKYIELESPMSIAKCGTVLDVGQDYILAGIFFSFYMKKTLVLYDKLKT